MAKEFSIKQGEARVFTITVKTKAGTPINLTSALCCLVVKESPNDANYLIFKDTPYFDKTNASAGIVSVTLADSDTWLDPGRYFVELKVVLSGQIVKTVDDVYLNVKKSSFVRRFVGVAGSASAAGSVTGAANIV